MHERTYSQKDAHSFPGGAGENTQKKTPFERRFLWSERFLFWTQSQYLFFKKWKFAKNRVVQKWFMLYNSRKKKNYSMSFDRPFIYVKLMVFPPSSKVSSFSFFPFPNLSTWPKKRTYVARCEKPSPFHTPDSLTVKREGRRGALLKKKSGIPFNFRWGKRDEVTLTLRPI